MEELSDAGSIPARSIICGKEEPQSGRIPYHPADACGRSPPEDASA